MATDVPRRVVFRTTLEQDSFIPSDDQLGELVLAAHRNVGRTTRTTEMGIAIRELLRAQGLVLVAVRASAAATRDVGRGQIHGPVPAAAFDVEPGPRERPRRSCGHDAVVLGCPTCEDGRW